jgi:hypothetical protein
VLVLGPAAHAVLVLHITLLVLIALTLEVRLVSPMSRSVAAATSQIFSKILVRYSTTTNFRRHLSRILLQRERIRLTERLIDVTLHNGTVLVLLVHLGLRYTIANNKS